MCFYSFIITFILVCPLLSDNNSCQSLKKYNNTKYNTKIQKKYKIYEGYTRSALSVCLSSLWVATIAANRDSAHYASAPDSDEQ